MVIKANNRVGEVLGIQLRGSLKDHWSQYPKKELIAVAHSFEQILIQEDSKPKLFHLDDLGFFEVFLPEIYALKKIPQSKQNSKNAFHHSLTIVDLVESDPMLRWAALLHDIGKANFSYREDGSLDFRNHEYEGFKLARNIVKRYKISRAGDICTLVRYHTHPLDYQRQPNWKMTTVKNFADKYGELAGALVDLAIADKMASSSNPMYLEDLYKLKTMVREVQYET